MPQRIQRQRVKGWRMADYPGAIDVTRNSEWGNPFRIGYALDLGPSLGCLTITRALAIDLYRAYVYEERGRRAQIRQELAGKDLVCWCPLYLPCHADVLLNIANPVQPADECPACDGSGVCSACEGRRRL